MAFIKLDRKILKWEWFTEPNTLSLWIYILLNASWENKTYRGVEIPRGSFTTGRKKMSEETGLTENEIRTALNHLKTTNEITIKTTKKYTHIFVEKWELYQGLVEEATNSSTNKQSMTSPRDHQETTTNKEYKEYKEIKEIKKEREKTRFSPPSIEEIQEEIDRKGYSVDAESFYAFYDSKNWMVGKNKMKNFKSALVTWHRRNKQESKGTWFE